MWVKAAAIRPVPPYAVVEEDIVTNVLQALGAGENIAEPMVDHAFSSLGRRQPALADRMYKTFNRPGDETARSLGYMLCLTIWLAFRLAFGDRVAEVSKESLASAEAALALEEELRALNAADPFELDDVLAREQPALVGMARSQIERALEKQLDDDVDLDEVHTVYRTGLLFLTALSYAVEPQGEQRPPDKKLLS